jgi:hypothetical protein
MSDPKKPSRSFDLNIEIATSGLAIVLALVIVGAGAYGWGLNIRKLMGNSCGQGNYGCLIVRGAGIPIVPVGAVAGYF